MKNRYQKILAAVSILFALSFQTKAQSVEPVADSPLMGKIIHVIGDSYVANHRCPKSEAWHYKVAQRYGMVYKNYGKNGNCVAFDRTKERFGRSMLQRYGEMDDSADIILIIAGHNDAGYVAHSADTLQLFGNSLNLLLTGLREKYPHARIGYVTPWYVDRPGFKQTVKMIKRVCRKHGVPVLDNYKKTCVIKVRDSEFRKKYFQGSNDTAHLNDAGHNLYLAVGEEFIFDLIKE